MSAAPLPYATPRREIVRQCCEAALMWYRVFGDLSASRDWLDKARLWRDHYAREIEANNAWIRANPEAVAADALALIKIGAGVARWAVRACNGEGTWKPYTSGGGSGWHWDEEHDAAKDKADARALAKLQAIADRYGAKVKLGGDPRGYVVKLILASGRHNTWGGAADGWGVA